MLGSSAAAIITGTHPSETVACAKITGLGVDIFIIFDPHPRPSYLSGAGLILSTSMYQTVAHLAGILPAVDKNLKEKAQRLNNVKSHIFVSNESPKGVRDVKQSVNESRLAVPKSQTETVGLKQEGAKLTSQKGADGPLKGVRGGKQPVVGSRPTVPKSQTATVVLKREGGKLTSENEMYGPSRVVRDTTQPVIELRPAVPKSQIATAGLKREGGRLTSENDRNGPPRDVRDMGQPIIKSRTAAPKSQTDRAGLKREDVKLTSENETNALPRGVRDARRPAIESRSAALKSQTERAGLKRGGGKLTSENERNGPRGDVRDVRRPVIGPRPAVSRSQTERAGLRWEGPKLTSESETNGPPRGVRDVRRPEPSRLETYLSPSGWRGYGSQTQHHRTSPPPSTSTDGHIIHGREAESHSTTLHLELGVQQSFQDMRLERVAVASTTYNMFSCAICMDEHPVDNTLELGCNHQICRGCIRRHVHSRIEQYQFPVHCPMCMTEQNDQAAGLYILCSYFPAVIYLL
jgi:hypothetical protein